MLKTQTTKRKILLTGSLPYWTNIAGSHLSRGGFEYDTLHRNQRLKAIVWFLTGRLHKYDYIYQVCGTNNWLISPLLILANKSFVLHWTGTDIISFASGKASVGWRKKIVRGIVKRTVAHVTDSEHLADDLLKIGIKASVVRLLTPYIEAEAVPLPEKFTVLSYWSDKRKNFYGGDIVLRLARDFPEVEFNILKATGSGENAPKNVHFLGTRDDMETVYGNTTVLIRLPEHDSLAKMPLEALARGRYVIYNLQCPNCHFASDYDSAKIALQEIMKLTVPNTEGAEFIKENFSPAKEAEKLKQILCNL